MKDIKTIENVSVIFKEDNGFSIMPSHMIANANVHFKNGVLFAIEPFRIEENGKKHFFNRISGSELDELVTEFDGSDIV